MPNHAAARRARHLLDDRLADLGPPERFDTLARAAAAMDCTLVYAFLPNGTLQSVLETKATKLLDGRV